MTIDTIFAGAAKEGASDIHLAVGCPITFRIDGVLVAQGKDALSHAQVEAMVTSVAGAARRKQLEEQRELDLSFSLKNGTRFRVNCHFERGEPGLVARLIPTSIPALEEIGLSTVAETLCNLPEGLVLFTGPTGAGKSTALASILQTIHQERPVNVVTLEDPIEFLFAEGKGIIRQRQCGSDFLSFPEALRHVLRQDPDIVMVGEMRDHETIAAALTLAETGHLVLATLHTPNAIQTVDRIVDVFPPHQQQQIRTQLSLSLKAIIAQRLLPREGGGRIAQREILINTPAVGHIIRDNRAQELTSVLQTGKEIGMTTFEAEAKRLYKEGSISEETYAWAKLA